MNNCSNRLPLSLNNRFPQKETGAAAIIVALSLAALVGFVGLALDLGKLFVAKTELQNSADACALAAARELTSANTNQLVLAEAAGVTTGENHEVLFQKEQITIRSVTFSETLTGGYQTAFTGPGAINMRYAQCEASRTGIANWFIQVLNLLPGVDIDDQTVAASAVATLWPSQITSCALPIGVCSNSVSTGTPVGTWLESVLGPAGSTTEGNLTGNFVWVDYTPPAGGASELAGQLTGPGVCSLPTTGTEVGEAGVKSSLANDWNSRFGIYQGNVKAGDSIPDYSGYAYTEINWFSKSNAFADFQDQRGNNSPYQGDANTGLKINGTIENASYLKANGEDRRLATVPIIDCSGFVSGSTAPVNEWACILMLHPINNAQGGNTQTGSTRMFVEYLGRSNDPNSPCATNGVPGGANAAGPLVPTLVR
ncbi:TadE/TadG family type IV pilus assembly protein [Nitrosomonas communis]|uniref:Putative Flp pilus-assembly TadE/G-like n=1 Tax=Nitrosomonas communis TaxID=44574 RepID=A0A1I4P5J9_9PROT|nr:Tad domain-containing protein [Nitrosomonas communis]SFM22643.1 Putative Flp pilus-assembly TadE/G-like [Nitrosomonas communis]